MWELRKALLKAQKGNPPEKGQSSRGNMHQPPPKGKKIPNQNPPQNGSPKSDQTPESDVNPLQSGQDTEPGKTHHRVVEPQSLKNPPQSGLSQNSQVNKPG